MSISCRFCYSEFCVKRGFVRQQQRYRCKTCRKHFILAPKPRGYAANVKIQALILREAGEGIRSIARSLAISHTALIYWFEDKTRVVKRLIEEEMYETLQDIEVIETKDIGHYSQRHVARYDYGMLLFTSQEEGIPTKLVLTGRSKPLKIV